MDTFRPGMSYCIICSNWKNIMQRVLAIFAVLSVLLPKLCAASSYDCTLKWGEAGQRIEIWSGKIVLKDGVDTVGQQYIVKNWKRKRRSPDTVFPNAL